MAARTFNHRTIHRCRFSCVALMWLMMVVGTATTTAQDTVGPPPDAIPSQQERQLQIFKEIVLSPTLELSPETRRNAAKELLTLDSPDAIEILDQALRSQKPPIMLAAITAMQFSHTPVIELLDAALSALPAAPTSVVESLSWVLARYGSDALEPVTALASDRRQSISNRLAPIQALSAFEGQAAAAALMRIADQPDEPAEIVAAACDALQRLSGLSYGTDLKQWRQWWSEAGELQNAEWRAYITKSLSKRAAQLQQELQKQRETNEIVARELYAAYRDLYPALPIDEQLRRLPPLLQNQFAAVREFAMSRVTVLLRDSVRVPMEVQHRLAERLNDDSSALRVQAAQLLDELNYEAAGSLIATRLAQETSPQIVDALLDVLIRRPVSASIEPARKWLAEPELGEKAANLLWKICEIAPLADEPRSQLAVDVRRVFQQRQTHALARLFALIGDESDLSRLTDLLDEDDPTLREAVADGFRQRGLRQPLIDRASDWAIYPYALRAMADAPVDLAAFRILVGLRPNDAHAALWNECVTKMLSKLSNGNLVAADDILATATYANGSLRQSVLTRALALPREELSAEQRTIIISRLAPMLIDQGEPARALTLLESIDVEAAGLTTEYFEAAALSGQYEKASEIRDEPHAWIELLTDVVQRDVIAAATLCREISRRFAEFLTPEYQAIIDQINETVQQTSSTAALN